MGINVKKIYLCSYGENTLDLPVVDYNDYEELYKQFQQLKQENEKLKKGVMSKCPQCDEIYLNNVACEIYEKIYEYKQCIDDIKKIILKYKLLDSNIFMSIPIPDTKKLFEILEKVKENE